MGSFYIGYISCQSLLSLTGETQGRGAKIKETFVLALLNVALPSVDVYSDLAMVTMFFSTENPSNPFCDEKYGNGNKIRRHLCYTESSHANLTVYTRHNAWGTMLLLPFLLNYLVVWYVWVTTDKRKAITWVAALLSFYPQFVACKIIWLIWTDNKKGLQKKRQLERDMIQYETFWEAVPSTLAMAYLLIRKSQ